MIPESTLDARSAKSPLIRDRMVSAAIASPRLSATTAEGEFRGLFTSAPFASMEDI